MGELDLELDHVDTLMCPYRNASFFAINNGLGCYMGDATIGSMATHSCNHGYSPVGSIDQRCLYNGNWNGTPKCNGTYYSFASRHEMHIIRVRLYRRVNFSHTLHAVTSARRVLGHIAPSCPLNSRLTHILSVEYTWVLRLYFIVKLWAVCAL